MITREQALHAFHLGLKHLGQGKMVESARLCLEDAAILLSLSRWEDARERSITSIAYSVGFLHADYQRLVR